MTDKEPSDTPENKVEPYVIKLDDVFWSDTVVPQGNADDAAGPTEIIKVDESNPYDTRFEVLRKASTQALDDAFDYGTTNFLQEIVEPLYRMEQLTNLNDISVVRAKCIEAMAAYTVGLGYTIKKLDPKAESADSDKISIEIRKVLERWASRGELTFTELMQAVKIDEETTGNAFIEVSRNRLGQIDGLYHVPAHTVRVRRDRSGYIQQRGSKKVPFYRFGDKVVLRDDNTIELLEDRDPKINELIHFKIFTPRTSYYGNPRDVAAIVTIAGDEMARTHNIKFFTYSATPELALVFEVDASTMPTIAGNQPIKVSIPESVKRQMIEHFRRNLSANYFEPGMFFLPNGVKLKIERLSQGQRDSGWTKYRQENRAEVRMAFRTPPVIIGDTSDSGYATAAIEKSVYQEGVIGPEQERYQQRIMALLWPEMVMIDETIIPPIIEEDGSPAAPAKVKPEDSSGVDPTVWVLAFKKMDVVNKVELAANHQIYGGMGALDINEIRQDIGRRPKDGGDKPPEKVSGNPNELRGLQGRPGGGRGPNGTVTAQLPRRVGEQTAVLPANLTTVGNPMSGEGTPVTKGAGVESESNEELIEKVFDDNDAESLDELKIRLEEDPELQEKLEEEYLAKVDDAFGAVMKSLRDDNVEDENVHKN